MSGCDERVCYVTLQCDHFTTQYRALRLDRETIDQH